MKDATDEILHELSSKGYRITKARKEVVKALASQEQPLSIGDVCKAGVSADEASVYRTIRTLVEEGFVEEIVVSGSLPRYALSHGHHHHAVCTSCGVMEHVACQTHSLSVPHTFKTIQTHEMTLYGLCKKCA